MVRFITACWLLCFSVSCSSAETNDDIDRELKARLAAADVALKADPENIGVLLDRGDAQFFLGRFDAAIVDYDRMIELRPDVAARHWQRGLALYFAGRYDDAAKQFERYYEGNTGDKSDRENGIWRYYAHVRKDGVKQARKQLLEYTLPDREPLPIVYRMCQGEVSSAEVLKSVAEANISQDERSKREFYAELYVGLDDAIVRKDRKAAGEHLRKAVENSWPRTAGYGGNFMWHVSRLSLAEVTQAAAVPAVPR